MTYLTKKWMLLWAILAPAAALGVYWLFLSHTACEETLTILDPRDAVALVPCIFVGAFYVVALAAPALILPFLIVLYFMRESVYKSWLKFLMWALPLLALAVFIIFVVPGGEEPGRGIGQLFFLVVSFGVYFILSCIMIVYAYFRSSP